jgi:imidazolonepropionase-like amidohydrolase
MKDIRAITADLMWDGLSDYPVPGKTIIIEGETIQKIIPEYELDPDQLPTSITLPGVTLMPGLIDSHTHLSMDPGLDNYLDHMNDSIPELTIRAVEMMRKDLLSGITTCRCLGDKEFLDITCREAVQNKRLRGPRLLVAGKGIRALAGHGFVGYPFEGLKGVKQAVQDNILKGVDLIKFYITGTLRGDSLIPSYLTREEIRSIIDEAHKAGLRAAAHCVGGVGLDWALKAGLDTLEHGYHISDRQIESLMKSSTWTVLTPSPLLLEDRIEHLPDELIPGHKREKKEIKSNMTKLISSGVPFAVGSDGLHGKLSQEIRYLVEMGASNVTALRAATIQGARVSGIDDMTGSLEAGKKADIIAVSGNPVKDIEVLNNIVAVMKEGAWMVNPEEYATDHTI